MNHPLAQYSKKDDSPFWAYSFIAITSYLAFFYQKGKNIIKNPIGLSSIEQRFNDIFSSFDTHYMPSIKRTEFIDHIIEQYLTKYGPEREVKDKFYSHGKNLAHYKIKHQDIFMPYFELFCARRIAHTIYMTRSKYESYYIKNISDFPKDRSAQWLYKYLKRRSPMYLLSRGNLNVYRTLEDGIENNIVEFWRDLDSYLTLCIDNYEHYLELLSLPHMTQARTIDFNKGTLKNLFEKLEKVTTEISDKKRRLEQAELIKKQSPTELFVDANDGWKWVKILNCYDRNRDDTEAILMGHCATPEWEDSYLVSLRDPKGVPWITATIKNITPSMMILGQVKGRGNRKPTHKHEAQLFSLFLKPEIIMQKASINDWQVDDFSTPNQDFILKNKPYLVNAKYLREYFNLSELGEIIHSEMSDEADVYDDGSVMVHMGKLSDIFYKHFTIYDRNRQKTRKEWWFEYLSDGHIDIDISINNEEAASWFKDEYFNTKIFDKIYNALDIELRNNDSEFEDKTEYVENLKWSFHYGVELGQTLYDSIRDSLRWSYEASLMQQLEKEIQNFLYKVHQELPSGMELGFTLDGKEIEINQVYYSADPRVHIKTDVVSILNRYDIDEIAWDNFRIELDDAIESKKSYLDKMDLSDYSSEHANENFENEFLPNLLQIADEIIKTSKVKKK